MSNTREILTLQFGNYTNFVGTHFWNIQEKSFDYTNSEKVVNHDILYREGETSQGQTTYTPRLLLVDLKGTLKHLSQDGNLYTDESSTDILTWNPDDVEIQTEPESSKNLYQKSLEDPNIDITDKNIEEEIQLWPDYLYGRFHPRTINIINEYHHDDPSAFETFSAGTSLWKTEAFSDDFTDKIRLYTEECDSMQGFQVLFDASDGFCGLASSCLDYLRDDFENKTILSIPIIASFFDDLKFVTAEEREKSTQKSLIRQINLMLGLSSISELSSLVVPISTDKKGWQHHGVTPRKFPFLNYNYENYYQSSAVLASALDTISLRYRRKDSLTFLSQLCNDLNGSGRKVAAASLSLPFGLKNDEYLIDCLDKWEGPLWEFITPNCSISTDKCLQSITVRGIPESKLKIPVNVNSSQREMPAYRCENVNEMFNFYLSCTCYATASDVTCLDKPLGVQVPFPKIFEKNVGENGFIRNDENLNGVNSVPALAGVHSSAEIGEMLETLHRETKRLKFSRFKEFQTAGLEQDEFNEKLNLLMELREAYIEEHFL